MESKREKTNGFIVFQPAFSKPMVLVFLLE